MVPVILRHFTRRRLTTCPATGVEALAQKGNDIKPQQGGMDSNWLKYAPPALAVHMKNIKNGTLLEMEAFFQKYQGGRSRHLISSFVDSLNEEEYQAAKNLEQVTGISMAALNTIYRSTYDLARTFWFKKEFNDHINPIMPLANVLDTSDCLPKRQLLRWENISRGTDLFISGLGTFNVNAAYDGALRRKRDKITLNLEFGDYSFFSLGDYPISREVYKEIVRHHFCGWVLFPQELQVFGYFPEVTSNKSCQRIIHILSEGKLCGNRIHLIKYSRWWNNPDNTNALDEIEDFNDLLGKPLEKIPGIESTMASKLMNVGIFTALDLAALTTSEQSELVPRLQNISIQQLAALVVSASKYHLERVPGIESSTSSILNNAGIMTAVDLAALTTSEQSDLVPRLTTTTTTTTITTTKSISIQQLAALVASANEHLIEENIDCVWPKGGAEMHPTQLLNRLRKNIAIREQGPDQQFKYLFTLLDPEPKVLGKQTTCAEPTLTLKTLRSSHAVVKAAKALHNCAQSYISKCKRGKYMLAVLEEDGTGKLKAMGGYEKNNGVWHVDQVVLNQNKTASVDVQVIFESFAETIQKWESKRNRYSDSDSDSDSDDDVVDVDDPDDYDYDSDSDPDSD